MPVKPRSTINVNSSVLSTSSVKVINANNVTVTGSITTPSISTDQLVVNGNDVTSVLQAGGNLNSNSATISGALTADDVITNSVGIVIATGTLPQSPATATFNLNNIVASQTIATNPTPTTQSGFICATVIDNTSNEGAVGLYTRAKILNNNFYNAFIEKTFGPLILSLNTDTGILTIGTNSPTNTLWFEIKALNLFEK